MLRARVMADGLILAAASMRTVSPWRTLPRLEIDARPSIGAAALLISDNSAPRITGHSRRRGLLGTSLLGLLSASETGGSR